jgi:hypothetical protein
MMRLPRITCIDPAPWVIFKQTRHCLTSRYDCTVDSVHQYAIGEAGLRSAPGRITAPGFLFRYPRASPEGWKQSCNAPRPLNSADAAGGLYFACYLQALERGGWTAQHL